MTLTPLQTLGIILAVAAGTQLTRWLPFWLFPEKKQPPAVVAYLGKVLLEAECAAVHRWGHCAVHGAGTGGVCVKKEKRCRPAEVRPAFFSAGRGFLLLGLDTGDAGGGLGKL